MGGVALPILTNAVLHAYVMRLAQGVIRKRIRTNESLGRASEVPPAAHAPTEALADGGDVFASHTWLQPIVSIFTRT